MIIEILLATAKNVALIGGVTAPLLALHIYVNRQHVPGDRLDP